MKWKPKTCKVETLGCKVNQYESQYFREMLELNGVVEALEYENPDLVLSTPAPSPMMQTPRVEP